MSLPASTENVSSSLLHVNLCGISFQNPLILASGILGTSGALLKKAAASGLGGVTTKSIGPRPRYGYLNPSVIEIGPGTCLNAVGLANPGIMEFVSEIPAAKVSGIPIIMSVFGSSGEEYKRVAMAAQDAGVDAIEMNISCPHAKVSSIGASSKLTHDTVSTVKNSVKIPIFVKLNPNVTNLVEIGMAAEDGGADAVVAINTIRGMAIDIHARKPILFNQSGGVSGKSIKPMAVKAVFDLYKALSIPVIGCGGIFSAEDVVEFMLAGASAVQLGTAFMHGWEIVDSIKHGLITYCNQYSIPTIGKIIGKAHEEVV